VNHGNYKFDLPGHVIDDYGLPCGFR